MIFIVVLDLLQRSAQVLRCFFTLLLKYPIIVVFVSSVNVNRITDCNVILCCLCYSDFIFFCRISI